MLHTYNNKQIVDEPILLLQSIDRTPIDIITLKNLLHMSGQRRLVVMLHYCYEIHCIMIANT